MMTLPQPKVVRKKISELTKAKTNVRQVYPEEAMEVLRNSIKSMGLLELPKVTPSGEVFAGWARVEACRLEGIEEIYVVEVSHLDEREQYIASLAENYARRNLEDDEVRYVLKRLKEKEGLTPDEISRVTGMNIGTVHTYLAFYRVIEEVDEIDKDLAVEIQEDIKGLPAYSVSEINQAVKNVPTEQKADVAKKMTKLAHQTHPSGRRTTRDLLKRIADQAKIGRDDVPDFIDQVIAEAAKEEYMVISMSIKESIYLPYLRWAKMSKKTIQELIIELMDKNIDNIKKLISENQPKSKSS